MPRDGDGVFTLAHDLVADKEAVPPVPPSAERFQEILDDIAAQINDLEPASDITAQLAGKANATDVSVALAQEAQAREDGDTAQGAALDAHVALTNPHGTSAADVGALTKTQADGYYDLAGTAAALVSSAITSVRKTTATGNGSTDDTTALQADLDACAAAGGGILFLPAGTYKISKTLAIGTNTWLLGAGMGATTIRPAGTSLTSKSIAGVSFYAVLATASTTGVHISDVAIDLRTNNTVANGIQINDHACSGSTSDVLVERVKVMGIDAHEYLVYSVKANRVCVRNCNLEGAASGASSSDNNCNECTGGTNVAAINNDCRNATTGVLFRSDLASTSPIYSGMAIGNRIDTCIYGIQTSATSAGGMFDIVINGNTITNMMTGAARAIQLTGGASTETRNITIIGNVCRESERTLMDFYFSSGSTTSNIIASGNSLYQTGNNDAYVGFLYAKDVTFSCNRLDGGGAYYGVEFNASSRCRFTGNTIRGSRRTGIQIQDGCSKITIEDNDIRETASAASTYPSINVDTGAASSDIWVNRNTFMPNTPNDGYVIVMTGCTSGGTVFDNFMDFIPSRLLCNLHATTRARRQVSAAPGNAGSIGDPGDWFQNTSYRYECTASSTWVRTAFAGGF